MANVLARSPSGWKGKWPDPSLPWPLTYDTVQALAQDEQGPNGGCALVAYLCPAGIWTCGWGETDGVVRGTKWDRAYADARFCDALDERSQQVGSACAVPPTSNELSAMTSLQYNIGTGAFLESSVLRLHNASDHDGAARAFLMWTKARNPKTGKLEELTGLVGRRHRESALYLTPDSDTQPQRMPQAVAPESSLAKSGTMTTGGALAGVGAVAGAMRELAPAPVVEQAPAAQVSAISNIATIGEQVTVVSSTAQTVKQFVADAIPIPLDWILPGVLVVGGGVVMWRRWTARRDGIN